MCLIQIKYSQIDNRVHDTTIYTAITAFMATTNCMNTKSAKNKKLLSFFPFKAIIVFVFNSYSFLFFLGLNSNSTPRLSL
jgi:hypothetical protein